MSATANASVSITCPDWCDHGAETHAADLWDNEGCCVHTGLIASVEDPTGQGTDWSPLDPNRVVRDPLIPVGLGVITDPSGRPVATPGIRLGHNLHTVEQIEALIPWLHEALRLAKEQLPAWKAGG